MAMKVALMSIRPAWCNIRRTLCRTLSLGRVQNVLSAYNCSFSS